MARPKEQMLVRFRLGAIDLEPSIDGPNSWEYTRMIDMKKLTRFMAFILSVALVYSAWPKAAYCAAAQKVMTSCEMPCCKTTKAQCPLIRPVAAQDAIAISGVALTPNYQVIATLILRDTVESTIGTSYLMTHEKIPESDPRCSTPQSVPAPPFLLA